MNVNRQRKASGVRIIWTLAGLALLSIGAGLLSGCGKKEVSASTASPPPMPVSVIKIAPADVPIANEWVGTMDGFVNAQIQPQAAGYLVRQLYTEGSQVAKDQVLFEIDPRPFQAVVDQAEGQLGQAKAQLALAQINVNRDTPLAEARAIARSQLDNEIQQKAQAEANVKSAEAAVETAKLNLSFCEVRSLISGVAGQATVQVGNLVNTQSVLTSVSQLNPIKVYFSISDSEYLALTHRAAKGQRGPAQRSRQRSADVNALQRRRIPRQGAHRVRGSPSEFADRRHSHRGCISQSAKPSASGAVWPR